MPRIPRYQLTVQGEGYISALRARYLFSNAAKDFSLSLLLLGTCQNDAGLTKPASMQQFVHG